MINWTAFAYFFSLVAYLLSHGHSSWGDDDISTADAFIQSIEKVIGAEGHKQTHADVEIIGREKNSMLVCEEG